MRAHTSRVTLVTHLPSSGYTAMPWLNGGGTTHEIAVEAPDAEAIAPFRWRLSMADLTGGGPFSEIPGVDRILVLLAGDDAALAIDGADPVPLVPLAPIAFPADVPTTLVMPPGTGRDLNLMWDRADATGAIDLLEIGEEALVDEDTAFAVAVGGSATIDVDGDEHVLGEHDAIRIDGGGAVAIVDGTVLLVRVG